MNVRVYATLRPIVGGPIAQLETDVGDTFRQMLDGLLQETRYLASDRYGASVGG